MKVYIYRCQKKKHMYIYLPEKDDFSAIPANVLNSLGDLDFALEINLTHDSKLAKEEPAKVLDNIKDKGFHIQMPSDIEDLLASISEAKVDPEN